MRLGPKTKELGNESCFCNDVVLCHPSNSALANHVDRLNPFECSRRALKGVITLSQPGSLFHSSVVLLNHIVEKLALAQANSPGQHTFLLEGPNGCWISGVLIHIDHAWNGIRRAAKYPLKEAFRRSGIAFGREQEINRLASGIHGSIEILLLPLHFDVGFVDTVALVGGLQMRSTALP